MDWNSAILADKKTLKLSWSGGTENAKANITSIGTKNGILNRVQPKTYAAMIEAAMDADVAEEAKRINSRKYKSQ